MKKWGSTYLIRLLFFSLLHENEKCYWIIFRVPIFHLETFRPTCRSVINHRKWCLPVRSSQHTTHSTYYSPSSLCSSLESDLTKCRFLFSRYRVRLVNKSYNEDAAGASWTEFDVLHASTRATIESWLPHMNISIISRKFALNKFQTRLPRWFAISRFSFPRCANHCTRTRIGQGPSDRPLGLRL